MKWLKWYFLKVADVAFLSGWIIGMVLGVAVVVASVLLYGQGSPAALRGVGVGLGLAMGFGPALGLVNWLVCRRCISHEGQKHGMFLRVDEAGKVVSFGNPLWGRGRGIHWCSLPFVRRKNEEDRFEVAAVLLGESDKGDVQISVGVTLTAFLSSPDFGPQELWDYVVGVGYAGVEGWLRESFQAAAATKEVQRAFQVFADSPMPVSFVGALTAALRETRLPGRWLGRWLGNIERIEAVVEVDSATYTSKVVYT